MNIRNNPSDNRPSPLSFDVTKPNREAIQSRQPLTPKPPTPEEAAAQAADAKAPKDPDAIEAAREAHRGRFRERVSAQRERYLENQAPARAEQAAQARNAYAVKRREAAAAYAPKSEPDKGGDRVEISDASAKLAERVISRAQQDDAARAARVSELKSRYIEGRLNDRGSIEDAADKMLRRE